MKIFTKNKVYVSRHDIVFILKERIPISYEVFKEIDHETLKNCDEFGAYSSHEFVEFTTDEAREYFRTLPFILDYDKLKDLDIATLTSIKKLYYRYKKLFEDSFPNLIFDRASIETYEFEIEIFGHLVLSYDEIIKYKQGILKIKMPKNYTVYDDNVDPKYAYFLRKMINYNKHEENHEKIYTR